MQPFTSVVNIILTIFTKICLRPSRSTQNQFVLLLQLRRLDNRKPGALMADKLRVSGWRTASCGYLQLLGDLCPLQLRGTRAHSKNSNAASGWSVRSRWLTDSTPTCCVAGWVRLYSATIPGHQERRGRWHLWRAIAATGRCTQGRHSRPLGLACR